MALMFVAAFATNTVVAQEKEVAKDGPTIVFEKNIHDYGNLDYAADGTCEFKFKNTGNSPLIISKAKGSCGCTVPQWPREPINPGQSGVIKVKYDTKRPGQINKSVTITSNAVNSPIKVIRIKGSVGPRPEAATPVNKSMAPSN